MSQTTAGPESTGALSSEDIRAIATRQKVVIACLAIQILAMISQFVIPPEALLMLRIASLGVGIVAMVFVFLLATKIYSTGMGVLLGVLTLIPLIGLIPLLIVNGKATTTLKQHGVNVGLFGAKT